MSKFKVGDRVRALKDIEHFGDKVGFVTYLYPNPHKESYELNVDFGAGDVAFRHSELTPVKDAPFATRVEATLGAIGEMLVEKNKAYGNSALDPVRVFSTGSAAESLAQRIDDKLSRIARGTEFAGEDTVDDLIGYLVLYKMAREDEQ